MRELRTGIALLVATAPLVLWACGDDAKDCEPPDVQCAGDQAQVCGENGLWETVLVCDPGTSCSLSINLCLITQGRSPCCL